MPYDPSDWDTADDTAKVTAQHFFTDEDGAHVTDESGANVLIDSSGMYVSDGTDNLAQFTNPTIIGKTGAGEPNFKIGNVSPFGDGIFVCNGSTVKLMLWEEAGTNGGYIQSGDGGYLGIYDGSLYFTPFGKSRFTILDTSNQSGFCIGGLHIYSGTLTLNVGSTAHYEATVWTSSTFNSTFHCTNAGQAQVFFANGDAGAGGSNSTYGGGVWGAEYWTQGSYMGWHVRFQSSITGTRRIDYLVIVPPAYSTV